MTAETRDKACIHSEYQVMDTRVGADGVRYRRYRCRGCGDRWTTYEVTEPQYEAVRGLLGAFNVRVPAAVRFGNGRGRNRKYSVSDDKLGDYESLRRKGLKVDEIATILKLERNE